MLALSGRILSFMSGLPFEQGEHHAAVGDCPWIGHASGWLLRQLAGGPACRAEALPVRLRSWRPTIGGTGIMTCGPRLLGFLWCATAATAACFSLSNPPHRL
jgi:hypothetical protein